MLCSLLLALAQFSEPTNTTTPMLDSRSVEFADLDADGFDDLVVAAANNDLIGWAKGDGAGRFGEVHVLTSQADGANFARAADLDGDGDLDVVGGSYDDGTIRVWKNLGGGIFGPEVIEANAVHELNDLEIVDVTGDGVLDILTASSLNNRIAILIGSGNANFQHIKVLSAPNLKAIGVTAADIDGDGLRDVVGTHPGGLNTNWFRNLGGGQFAAGVDLVGFPSGYDVDAIDADLDGDDDLLLSGSNLYYYENLGGGTFAPATSTTGFNLKHLRVVDLDGDGDEDVIVGTQFSSSAEVYRNDGGGSFTPVLSFVAYAGKWNDDVAYGDLNGDGLVDFATTSKSEDAPRVYLGTGPGNLGGATAVADPFPVVDGPRDVAFADLDSDGLNDMVVGSFIDGRVSWFRNLGGGAFDGPQVLISNDGDIRRVLAADFDGDGFLDVASLRYSSPSRVQIVYGDGTGQFASPVVAIPSSGLLDMGAADFDGDGMIDFVLMANQSVRVYTNMGAGQFASGPNLVPGANSAKRLHVRDLDGDGDADIVAAFQSLLGVRYFSNSGGAFGGGGLQIGESAAGINGLASGDLDGNGLVDIVMASVVQGQVRVSYQAAPGFFLMGALVVPASSTNISDIEIGDVTNDGLPDLVVSTSFNSDVHVQPGLGDGTFGPAIQLATTTFDFSSVAVGDLDGDGDLDVAYTSIGADNVGIVLNHAAFADCNGNGFYDAAELANGTATDFDGDGVLDECLAPPLYADGFAIDAAIGGAQTFALNAGAAHAGELYIMVGSLSGTAPGMPLGSLFLPINVDTYTNLLLTTGVVPLAPKFGVLDGNGQATATLTLPPGLANAYVGQTAHHAFVTFGLDYTFASNAVPLTIE